MTEKLERGMFLSYFCGNCRRQMDTNEHYYCEECEREAEMMNLGVIKLRMLYNADGEQSSNVAMCGYRGATRTLRVVFHTGGVYDYLNVPWRVVGGLLRATSKGQYLNRNIKGKYEYRRIV